MLNQSDPPNKTMNTLSQMFQNIFSYNSNIMLAAIISLLLVILFVLLLHLYAKWFLAQAQAQARRRRRRRRTTVTVSDVLGPARFHHFHSFNIEDSSPSISSSSHTNKGLDSTIIASIPLFMYAAFSENMKDEELECVICLSGFEEGEMGRCLPKCGHGFHVECIDMWLSSHSNCPTCRAPIVVENDSSQVGLVVDATSSALVDIVIDDDAPNSEISNEHGNNESGGRVSDSSSSVSETSSSLLDGCSLKRMLRKVFPSSNNNVNVLPAN